MNDNSFALGIDIGGTNTQYGIVDAEGSIVAKGRIPTTGHASPEALIDALYQDVTKTIGALPFPVEISSVGAGVPCANTTTGEVDGAANLPWSHFPLANLLSDKFGVRAVIANDANAAAAGERLFGAAKSLDNFIMLTLGTGVGAGIYCDGHLLNGSHGFAGELGHIPIIGKSERMCACGRPGCLQTYCSASGIVETARQFLGFTKSPSKLRDIPEEEMTSGDVYKAAKEGDQIAKDVFNFTGEIIGKALAGYLAFCDPDAVVLFGGVARSADLLIPTMKMAMNAYALNIFKGKVDILVSALPDDDAAILGAAALGVNK